MNTEIRKNFERAFSSCSTGCRIMCSCYTIYYDGANSYDWEEGEFEELRLNPKAVELPYSVASIIFQGKEYVMDCECWVPLAEKFLLFIDQHGRQIVEFLKLEKKRKQQDADESPSLE